MEHEGMVHALAEIRRTLRPGGALIDLRPLSADVWMEVEGPGYPAHTSAPGGWDVVGKVDEAAFVPDDEAADAATGEAVNRGWFHRVGNYPFDFRWTFDTLEELVEYSEEHWEEKLDDALMTRVAERLAALPPESRISVRREMRFSVYQKR